MQKFNINAKSTGREMSRPVFVCHLLIKMPEKCSPVLICLYILSGIFRLSFKTQDPG